MAEIQFRDVPNIPSHIKLAVVISRFNEEICQGLLNGARRELRRLHAREDQVDVYWVPGAFEIPVTVKKLCVKKNYDAIICLGAVIRGETPHFDYVCENTLHGITHLAQTFSIPILNGIITANTLEQAQDRSAPDEDSKHGNLGTNASQAAAEMIYLFAHLDG